LARFLLGGVRRCSLQTKKFHIPFIWIKVPEWHSELVEGTFSCIYSKKQPQKSYEKKLLINTTSFSDFRSYGVAAHVDVTIAKYLLKGEKINYATYSQK
jgi:hypothetical protein